ncbi:nucleotidyl transferase AbiEii/AbiGii toxin family protein [Algoriphagus antarcticus]|uniref:Nucleotidyltransferase AbiEii toxin of type IV toxin-antitoxin system n=1 Tax=Algoriphagus antarcticus TaxID=238540 RepID=A0A3E0E3U8_9BACT|nr:nucleotidyl transferase AbiEii/AbiGii toxin family protein [Algoriphagus antarcticus]REG92019.1 nucleotidyltransferase AbiEii toxin of type IV toxin-antitoxin system [Algoriphagus antarcticus]
MKIPELESFGLVGGTAHSLKFGHRISVDLDLFSNSDFLNLDIEKALNREFGSSFIMEEVPKDFGIFCYLEDVKVDIVRHPHPLIGAKETIDDIRFFSNQDIMAMKLRQF